MTYIISALCLRDGACVDVCPVNCIVHGMPESDWPWFYIDPDTCIDCGACVPVCPYEAIWPEDEVSSGYTFKAGQYIADTKANLPDGRPLGGVVSGHHVTVANAKAPGAGLVIDLTPAIELNKAFFKEGPGYNAKG